MVESCQKGEEEHEMEENHESKMRNEVTRGIIAGVPKEADTVGVVSLETLYHSPKA